MTKKEVRAARRFWEGSQINEPSKSTIYFTSSVKGYINT